MLPMAWPYEAIARAIREDRVVYSIHAENQLTSRGIPRWQAAAGFLYGACVETIPDAKPNPKIRVAQLLPDGTEVVAVWSYVRSIERAKLVTLYFKDKR